MFGECHAHIFMDGLDYKKAVACHRDKPDESLIRMHLKAYKDRHITFVRDGGDKYGASLLAGKLAPEYGITYLTPGFALHQKGHYGGIVGLGFDNLKEYHQLVKKLIAQGGDFVKIMTTGIMDFKTARSLTEEPVSRGEVTEMVHIAHEEGMKVMSHTNGAEAVMIAAEAGVDSLEHGNFQNQESLQALAESGAVWVPTTVTVKNLIGCGRFDDKVLREIFCGVRENILTARRMKVKMALGSDAGAYLVPHGRGLCDEYEVFRELFPEDKTLEKDLAEGERMIRSFTREGERSIHA